ncbi:putative E3 ubiquitin-protein ligase ARI2 isoform X1 [Silene latifolia]|uniref:putative E3 ubiquitin-protein ligase ARI2 isoform X1 n=1 Tax=Silene latifolia TaxID=37657 RepID=UPI003D788102
MEEDYADSDTEYYYDDDNNSDNNYEEEDENDDGVDCLNGIQDVDDHLRLSLQNKKSPIQVITRESLAVAQREDLRRIMDVLSLKEHHARTLLIHYRWDVERVLAVLVERGKDQLYVEAGVKVIEHSKPCSSSSSLTCGICIEDKPANELMAMDCGHSFCNICWAQHFVVRINEGQSRRIKCMAYQCNAICDDGKIRLLLSMQDSAIAAKFDRFILESYIEDNKRVKWCPSVPHCGNAIRADEDEFLEVECACGHQFCFGCCGETHSPCSCLMWELWMKKCQDESETVNWITSHTKPCPKCHKAVEKNGGCNLVVCVCGQAFCWVCGGATGRAHTYQSIAGHSCGRFKEEDIKKTELAKKEWWRYIHYHNRYKAHTDSYKLEDKLKETIQEKILTLEDRETESKDMSWVTNALYRLFRSRRILSYSYPFAYYMFGTELFKNEMSTKEREIKQNLFEDQQQQLEANVERLSLYLEEPFHEFDDYGKVMESRMKIITMTNVVDSLCRNMYDCIENDLLGPLRRTTHIIAPYMSKGLEKASKFCDWRMISNEKYSSSIGGGIKGSSESSSGLFLNQDESECSSRKRARPGTSGLSSLNQDGRGCTSKELSNMESFGSSFFDLNLPADKIFKS